MASDSDRIRCLIRAQRIAYVKDQQDKTIEKIENKEGNVFGEKWEVQQAWDKQNEFLKAQARARRAEKHDQAV